MLNFYTRDNSVGGPSLPNGEVSGNGNNTNAAVSQDVILNGDRFAADTRTSSFQPCEASCNTRALLQQREEDLLKELSSLRAQCHEKDMEIVCLKDKVSELKTLAQEKESEFEQKMEETVQELMKVKKVAFLINGNFAKRNSEFEELKKELQTKKENELRLKAMGSKLREEVKSLRQGLGEIRQEIFHGNMSFSQQAIRLQNLLTSFQGRIPLSNAGRPRVCKSEDCLLEDGLNPFPKDKERNVEVKEESGLKDKMYSECAVFRAEEYFEFQQSEFDFLKNIAIANGPFRACAATRTVPQEIAKAESPAFDQEPSTLGHTKTASLNGRDQSSNREISSPFNRKSVNGSCNFIDPRPVPPRGVNTNAGFTAPLTNHKAAAVAGSTARMWHPHGSPPKSTPGYLNNRPLPANSQINTYRISKTQRATRYLNNRPLPPDSNIAGSYPSSWKPVTEEQEGGFFGRTLSQWF